MTRRWLGAALAAAVLLAAAPAAACSLAPGYRIPSNFELVHGADLIVLARVSRAAGSLVELAPVRALKGRLGGEPLRLVGSIGWGDAPLMPSPTPLRAVHFSAGAGACVRTSYPRGGLVVAMFRRTAGGLSQLGSAFARTAEDVEGEDGLWVRAVETYAAAQAGVDAPGLRRAAEDLRARLAPRRDHLPSQAMADDLQAYLDRTAPGGPLLRGGSRWAWIGGTDGAAATIHGSTPGPSAGFRCTAGEPALRVDLAHVDGAPRLALAIGDRRFEAEGEERLTMAGGTQVGSGLIPFTPELAAAMRSSPAPAGIAVDGTPLLIAAPADVLQKLALACAAVLSPAAG